MIKRPNLRECPFCASAAWFSGYTVQCKECGSSLVSGERGECIELWNRRVHSPEVTALVEAARDILSTKASGYVEPLVYELPFARLADSLAPFTEKETTE